MAELTYKEQLQTDYERIRSETRAGKLPIEQRLIEIKEASEKYAEAMAEDYDSRVSAAVAEGKKPGVVPIPYKDDQLLYYMANLCMDGYLRWSHPDKMSIVEYPILSDWQQMSRWRSQPLNDDLQYGDRRGNGRRKTFYTDKNEVPQVRNHRMPTPYDPEIEEVGEYDWLYKAIDNAGLTDRQREAIDLVYFGNMTQRDAGIVMDVSQQAVDLYIRNSIEKLREFAGEYC